MADTQQPTADDLNAAELRAIGSPSAEPDPAPDAPTDQQPNPDAVPALDPDTLAGRIQRAEDHVDVAAAIKAWVRKEIALLGVGHTEAEREAANP